MTIKTPEFRLSFASLFEPRENKASGKKEFDITMIFEPDQVAEMRAEVTEMVKEQYGTDENGKPKTPARFKTPFRKGVQLTEDNPNGFDLVKYPAYKDKVIVKANSQFPVGIVGPNAKLLQDPTAVYPGCYGKAILEPALYPSVDGGAPGAKFYLVGFQKTRDGEPLASRINPETAFEPFTASGVDNSSILDDVI